MKLVGPVLRTKRNQMVVVAKPGDRVRAKLTVPPK